MYLNIPKLINFYDQCHTVIKTKSTHLQTIINYVQIPLFESNIKTPTTNIYIIKNIIKTSMKIFQQFQIQLKLLNNISYESNQIVIQNMKQKIKNYSETQIHQDQLMQELLQLVSKQRQKLKDPIIYYDVKLRQFTKSTIEMKINEIQKYRQNTQEVSQPLYAHKLQRQTKSNLLIINSNQINYNQIINDTLNQINANMSYFLANISQALKYLNVQSQTVEIRTNFLQSNQNILRKRGKLNEGQLLVYLKSVGKALKSNKQYYYQSILSCIDLKNYLINIQQNILKKIFEFEEKQKHHYENIGAISQQVSIIMNLKSIFNLRENILRYFKLKNLQQINYIRLKQLINFIEIVELEFKQMEQLTNRQLKSINQSGITMKTEEIIQNFKYQKQFLESGQKRQKNILVFILKQFSKFLLDFRYIFANDIKDTPSQYSFNKLQQKYINRIMNTLFSSQPSLLIHNKPIQKSNVSNQLESQIIDDALRLIEQLNIFEIDSNLNVQSFTCALGPRLLLYGRIYCYYEGIYFDSRFNKKNLLFGKTKLFIPRKQLCGFTCKNVFGFIPDVIEVETKKGTLVFHSLGWRNHALQILNQCYFPQIILQQQQPTFQEQFHKGEILKPVNLNSYLKPLKQHILNQRYQLQLPNFFKKYLSEDKFEFQGKQYQNFKTYFLTEIGCIQPKSTPITPQAPFYFQYKSTPFHQNIPEKSQRLTRYRKQIPKIPFLSSGGQFLCQQKQVYYWISPTQLVGQTKTQVMGFSLTQGMEVVVKTIWQQQDKHVVTNITGQVEFATDSFANKILGSSALSNLKDTCIKQHQLISRSQKMKRKKNKNSKQQKNIFDIDQLRVMNQFLEVENKKLKKKIIILSIFMVCTLFILLIIASLLISS